MPHLGDGEWIMDRASTQSSEILLARLNHEVEKISALQHWLARRKAILQEQITRLRLGVSPSQVRLALKGDFGRRRQAAPMERRLGTGAAQAVRSP
jgi:hypothetical protein